MQARYQTTLQPVSTRDQKASPLGVMQALSLAAIPGTRDGFFWYSNRIQLVKNAAIP